VSRKNTVASQVRTAVSAKNTGFCNPKSVPEVRGASYQEERRIWTNSGEEGGSKGKGRTKQEESTPERSQQRKQSHYWAGGRFIVSMECSLPLPRTADQKRSGGILKSGQKGGKRIWGGDSKHLGRYNDQGLGFPRLGIHQV